MDRTHLRDLNESGCRGAVIGGRLGECAAALGAARLGRSVILTEETHSAASASVNSLRASIVRGTPGIRSGPRSSHIARS